MLEHVGRRLRVLIRDTISQVPNEVFTKASVAEIVGDPDADPAIADELLKSISRDDQAALLAKYADNTTLRRLTLEEVVEQQVIASFTLSDTIFNFEAIKAQIEGPILDDYKKRERLDEAEVTVIRFYSWLDSEFLTTPMSSVPALAGVRTALIGSAGLMIVVVLVALPIGVGAAFTWKNTRITALSTASSRRMCATWLACPPSFMACWAWRSSCAPWRLFPAA